MGYKGGGVCKKYGTGKDGVYFVQNGVHFH